VISAGPITIDPEKREARVHGDLLLLAVDEYHLLASLAASLTGNGRGANCSPSPMPSATGG
jgi:DNA-binding response OmpR family regulator